MVSIKALENRIALLRVKLSRDDQTVATAQRYLEVARGNVDKANNQRLQRQADLQEAMRELLAAMNRKVEAPRG